MKRTIHLSIITAILVAAAAAITAEASSFSEYWYRNGSEWMLRNGRGEDVVNAWVCDDAVPENGKDVWYLMDGEGRMITDGLVKDGTGNYYSLETGHEGHYGMLRYRSGTYDGIYLELESAHNGSFASIKNIEGIEALRAIYGVTNVSGIRNANCVYTSAFTVTGETSGTGSGSGSWPSGSSLQKNTLALEETAVSADPQKSNYEKIIRTHDSSPTAFYPSTPVYGEYYIKEADYLKHFLSDQILPDMVDKMVSSLEKIKRQDYSGKYYLENTGIYYDDFSEGAVAANTLRHMFASASDIIVECGGTTECYLYKEREEIKIYHEGGLVRGGFIFVGFVPGADPQRALDRHYQTKAVIDSLVAQAPEGDEEAAEFFHDKVCGMTTYDHAGLDSGNARHDAADAVLDGCCVCSGYADTFLSLAYYAGLNVGYISIKGTSEDSTHAINVVNLDGVWYEYDCTADDSGDQLSHRVCKVRLDEESQAKLNRPPFR